MANLKQECLNLRHLLGESNQAKALLQEALDKSAILVTTLEEKLHAAEMDAANCRRWWNEEKDTVRLLKEKMKAMTDQSETITSLSIERESLMARLNQCLGWIANAQSKGPYGAEVGGADMPYWNGSR